MKEEKKYILVGEKFYAKDGDVHYVNARRLLELYRLNPKDCILLESQKICFDIDFRMAKRFNPNAIIKYPQHNYE